MRFFKKYWKLIFLLGIFILVDIGGTAYLVTWREVFFDSLKAVNMKLFYNQILTFSIIAGILVISNGYLQYVQNILTIKLRNKSVKKLIRNGIHKVKHVVNFKQKIESDSYEMYSLGLDLFIGLIKAGLNLIVLSVILLNTVQDPITIVLIIIYVLVSTVLGRLIANPLIKINYDIQTKASDFREHLTKKSLIDLNLMGYAWAKSSKKVSFFQSTYQQVSVIIPFLFLASDYFSGVITFGILMALTSVIANLLSDAGYVIQSQDRVNRFIASKRRFEEVQYAEVDILTKI